VGVFIIEGGKLSQTTKTFAFFNVQTNINLVNYKPFAWIVANCRLFLVCWLFKLIKYFPIFTLSFATITFCHPTCFCKPSNFETNNLSFVSIELQTLHFTMETLEELVNGGTINDPTKFFWFWFSCHG
jgi:uncharacterized membrane protein